MREEIELIQRRPVRDTMSNIAEARRDREQDVLGCRCRAERAELTNCVVPAANAIEQTGPYEAREKVARRRR